MENGGSIEGAQNYRVEFCAPSKSDLTLGRRRLAQIAKNQRRIVGILADVAPARRIVRSRSPDHATSYNMGIA
jgi:hypothetical protein